MKRRAHAAKKRRNRIEAQIARAVQTDPVAAWDLAMFGSQRTLVEKAMWVYLHDQEICQDQSYKKYDPDGAKHALASQRDTETLCKLFLDAVDRRDGGTLRAMALVVENYERNPEQRDQMRLHILFLKDVVERNGIKLTVKALATLLNVLKAERPGGISTGPTAGYCAFVRRVAKSLGFPLAKPGRPKTVPNKG